MLYKSPILTEGIQKAVKIVDFKTALFPSIFDLNTFSPSVSYAQKGYKLRILLFSNRKFAARAVCAACIPSAHRISLVVKIDFFKI